MEREGMVYSISIEQNQSIDVTNRPRRFIFGTVVGGLGPEIGYEVTLQWICTVNFLQWFVEYENPFRVLTYQNSHADNEQTAAIDRGTSGLRERGVGH